MDNNFFKKSCFILGILIHVLVFAKEDCKSSTSLKPEIHYGECFDTGDGNGIVFRKKVDFNNDGLVDEAYGFSGNFGNGGGPWTLYLQLEKDKYTIVDQALAFHPEAINITPLNSGRTQISTYSRLNASEGTLIKQEISKQKVKPVSTKKIGGRNSEYLRLFGNVSGMPSSQSCPSKDFTKHSCSW